MTTAMSSSFRLFLVMLCLALPAFAQQPMLPVYPATYQATAPRLQDLEHTRLEVSFDYTRGFLQGKAWITFHPHAYATDSLLLDAQGMDIHGVSAAGKALAYTYDQQVLHIHLPQQPGHSYTVYIAYTAKPGQLKTAGSKAITSARGLYFINPDSSIAGKPVQIWTQGEQQASSAWFPTIDRPNQRMTTEISMTVPDRYRTLSNGVLVRQLPQAGHLRTDTWKMTLPHAPYLVAMVVGDFADLHDQWEDMPLHYFVEHKDSASARALFHNTPAMLTFFSQLLGVRFPWPSFNQVIVRDYVSGAMENTTLVVHGDALLFNQRQLLDANYFEGNVAHELFHQWFGDYVTTESWSNLTLNESFANFAETLWKEHHYGADDAAWENQEQMGYYFRNPADAAKPLVRFSYDKGDDMIDGVTYQKGGRILNMLRHYLGDSVFFKGMQLYLQQHALQAAEVPQWRLALEAVSGLDLNWFFNQWYYGAGHPHVQVDYAWDAANHQQSVYLRQTQDGPPFQLPIAVDVYVQGRVERHWVWAAHAVDTLRFTLPAAPDLVNVDAGKTLLAQWDDHKTMAQYAFQYAHAPSLADRQQALRAGIAAQNTGPGKALLLAGLKDSYYRMRMLALDSLQCDDTTQLATLQQLVLHDPATLVQASALGALARMPGVERRMDFFADQLRNPSYSVQAVALRTLAAHDLPRAFRATDALEKDSRGRLDLALLQVYRQVGDTAKLPVAATLFDAAFPYKKWSMINDYVVLLAQTRDAAFLQRELDKLDVVAAMVSPGEIRDFLLPALVYLQQHSTQSAMVAQIIAGIKNRQV